LSFIGYAEIGAAPRYWLGSTYLLEGLPLIPVVLGLFAVSEVLKLAIRNTSNSRVPQNAGGGGMLTGILDAGRNWWLVLRRPRSESL
jgi:TctA family transporter